MRPITPIIALIILIASATFAGGGATTAPSDTPADEQSPDLMLFQDIPVVVAAGMREQTVHQAAASVSVVNADDIELFNYRSLADVLRGQRSFYVNNNGLNSFIGVRGFQRPGDSNDRILLLQDGRPTNELIYGESHFDQDFTVPMEAVKRVEIIRGPGSSLYGTNAMFGVVNEITKDGADINGIVTKAEGGSGDTVHGNVLYGEQFKGGWDVMADITGFSSNGNNDIIYDGVTDQAHDFGHIRNGDDRSAFSGIGKIKNGDITLEVDSGDRFTDDSSATYLTSFFNPGELEERRTNVTLRLDHDFNNGQDLHAMVYYGRYDFRLTSPYDLTESPIPFNYYSDADDDWVGEQFHYGWQATKQLHLLMGADATQSLNTRQYDSDSLNGPILNVPASYNSFGIFAEGEYQVTKWLDVTAGGRFDKVQRVGSNFSPRVAVIVTPTKHDTFKLLYGSAFRSPNLSDLLYATPPPSGVIANTKLKPETIGTYEVAWERQYDNGWTTSLNGYLWQMANTIDTATLSDGSTQQQNMGRLTAHGVEGEIGKEWDSGASVRAYGTYSRAEQDGGGLDHSPGWITGASLAFPVYGKNNFLAIEPQFVGPMKNDFGDRTGATFLTNIVFTSRDFAGGWTFQAGAYNLFANNARLPRDGPSNQFETTLDSPSTEYLVSLSKRF